MQDTKKRQKFAIWAPSHNFVGLYFCNEGTYGQSEKNLLNSNVSPTCPHNVVNFGQLAAEIRWRVLGIPANFNWFRILAALVHGALVVGVSQTLQRWTESATYIRQGSHHVGHWPTFLVFHFLTRCIYILMLCSTCLYTSMQWATLYCHIVEVTVNC